MNDIKISLTVLVQGATTMSEQECSKQLKVPVIVKKGKYKGLQAKDREGNLLWKYIEVPDPEKCDKHVIKVTPVEKGKKDSEFIVFYTRRNKEIRRVINMTEAAYENFTGSEVPQGYHAPKGFKPYKPTRSFMDRKTKKWVDGMPIHVQAWKAATSQQRLEWHLKSIAEGLGGRMDSYKVFDD